MTIKSLSQLKSNIDKYLNVLGIDTSNTVGDTVKLALIGATSVGKSSTINALIGEELCPVGHVGNTTKKAGWVPFTLTPNSNQPDIILLDLPGWGVSKNVDEDYKTILKENLPQADAVLWVMKADSLGNLAYDLDWIKEIVLPSLNNDSSKIVLGLNQIQKVYDYQIKDGQLSEMQREIVNNKCQLIYEQLQAESINFDIKNIQPYSSDLGIRLMSLLASLIDASGNNGWILQLIANIKEQSL